MQHQPRPIAPAYEELYFQNGLNEVGKYPFYLIKWSHKLQVLSNRHFQMKAHIYVCTNERTVRPKQIDLLIFFRGWGHKNKTKKKTNEQKHSYTTIKYYNTYLYLANKMLGSVYFLSFHKSENVRILWMSNMVVEYVD